MKDRRKTRIYLWGINEEEDNVNVKEFLQQANGGQWNSERVYEFFVKNISTLFVLYIRAGIDKNPFMTRGNSPGQFFTVAFTDQEATEQVRLQEKYKVELVEEPILPFLLRNFRSQNPGLVLNPGLPSRFYLNKNQLHQLITEYAVHQLSQMQGAWIPTMNDNMLLVEYQQQSYTVAIYARKEDAELMCEEAGGMAVLHNWDAILARAKKVNAQSLFLHFHLPEQMYLSSEHMEKILKGTKQGFQEITPTTHSYQVRVIGEESEPEQVETQPQQAGQVEKPSDPKVQEPHLSQPEAFAQGAFVQQEEPKEEKSYEPHVSQSTLEEIVQEKRESQEEAASNLDTKLEEVQEAKSAKKSRPNQVTKSYYPSERSNPYSIKNKKEDEFEIYIGGGDVQQTEEEVPLLPRENLNKHQPARKDPTISRKEEPVSQKAEPQRNQSVESTPVAEKQDRISQQRNTPVQPQKEERMPQGNQGLAPAVREGLERLERATVEGQGMANGWEVCQVLAEIRRIWIIVDQAENMVILAGQDQSPIVDFFTSDVYAQQLIKEAHQNNPNLPPMSPQLVSTKKLYRALAPRQPIVWINRGSPGAWTSVMGDTLPYVMQLMTQMEQEKT